MPSPFFDEPTFRRDLIQGREFERRLGDVFATPEDVRMLASEGGLDTSSIDFAGGARKVWAATLDHAARTGRLRALVDAVKAREIHATLRAAIAAAEAVASIPPRVITEAGRPTWYFVVGVIVGIACILIPGILIVALPAPSAAGAAIYRILTALGAASLVGALPGYISVPMKNRVAIAATGALAMFVIVFFWNPVSAVVEQPDDAVIIVPDANMARTYSTTEKSPFRVKLDDGEHTYNEKLPKAGFVVGTGDISEGTMMLYLSFLTQNQVVERSPVRLPVRLQRGKSRTVKVTHREVECLTLDIDPELDKLIILEWTKCYENTKSRP